jgi:catechol 2,3-dioxygenase
MDTMENFYAKVISLHVTDRGNVKRLGNVKIVFMSSNPASHHQFVLIERAEQSGPSCINQISFKVASLSELRQVFEKLTTANVAAVTPINHGNAWSLYSHDPDGNGIEIYMDTPWHVAQPHGDPLDMNLSDDEILHRTEVVVRADPTFRPAQEWSESLRQAL